MQNYRLQMEFHHCQQPYYFSVLSQLATTDAEVTEALKSRYRSLQDFIGVRVSAALHRCCGYCSISHADTEATDPLYRCWVHLITSQMQSSLSHFTDAGFTAALYSWVHCSTLQMLGSLNHFTDAGFTSSLHRC